MTQYFKRTFKLVALVAAAWFMAPTGAVAQEQPVQSNKYITYAEAYKEYMAVDKPMLLIVTATWCTACTELKNGLDGLNRPERLSVVLVDFDRENTIAKSLLRDAKTIPHVVMFYKDKITGKGQSPQFSNPSTSRLRSLMNDTRIKYPTKNSQTSGPGKSWR